MTLPRSNGNYYHRQGLLSLFLMCAFPLHFWTLLLAFRDISWVIERTNVWDAIGVASYGMIYAFIESLLVFIVASLLGLLISRSWSVERRVALLSVFTLVISLWAMVSQLYFLWEVSLPDSILQALAHNAHPVRTMYMALFTLTATTFVIPAYFVLQSDKGLKVMRDLVERITLLSMFYIFLSFVGLVIVIIRNV